MINPISSNNAAVNKITAEQALAKAPVQAEATQARIDAPNADVVEISHSAQAKVLKQEGLTIPQIAIKLGLDVKTVTTYFPQPG